MVELRVMSENNRKILVLLDAHAILHRAFHALPDFTSPKGEPTGALYGFAALLIKVIRELKPDYIATLTICPSRLSGTLLTINTKPGGQNG